MDRLIAKIAQHTLGAAPTSLQRCATGQGNYVYTAACGGETYIIRCNTAKDAYAMTIHWLDRLSALDIPVPKVIGNGHMDGCDYLLLSYIEGNDLGEVYESLTAGEKQRLAKDLVAIQKRVSTLSPVADPSWSWFPTVDALLCRAEERIRQNGYFDADLPGQLRRESDALAAYFASVQPTPYLDDISTKNLLIHGGRLSGIIDIDEMGLGDPLTYVALTYMALLNEGYDTDYIGYIWEEMTLTPTEKRAFLFYSLVYCVDFMGERGMRFLDKQIDANPASIARLNRIYQTLWDCWIRDTLPPL